MKILLKKNLDGVNKADVYSIECGEYDGKRHFNHHEKSEEYSSPCNTNIDKANQDDTCYISHIDADTFVGLIRLFGDINVFSKSDVNLELMEQLDIHGNSILDSLKNTTYLYMTGIDLIANNIKFPIATDEAIDVTSYIEVLMEYSINDIVKFSEVWVDELDMVYVNSVIKISDKLCLIHQKKNDLIDPSRAFKDGYDIVVLFNEYYKAIHLYSHPNIKNSFTDLEISGIKFGGHPHALGSQGDNEYDIFHAKSVANTIYDVFLK